jgi:hypothetical protein
MAIVKSLKHWKIYLLGARYPVEVHTDHKNLRTFLTSKELDNRRMARWAEELAHYDLIIKHIAGKDNPRADALSRQPGYEDDKVYKKQAILKEDKDGNLVPNSKVIAALTKIRSPWYDEIMAAWDKEPNVLEGTSRYEDGKLKVPDSYAKEFIQRFHEAPEHGYQGIRRTFWRIQQQYYIDKLRSLVKNVVTGCDTCIRNKLAHYGPYGLMGKIPIPERLWKMISWDFIVKLPLLRDLMTSVEYDSIIVTMERLTKYMILILYKESSTAKELAYAFIRYVFADHGTPEGIISDRDKLFTSKLWTAVTVYMGIKRKLSTSFRPQTNGGNERMN